MWALHYDKQEGNFKEYADMNIRYLLSSGIIKRAGRGITLVPESRTMASVISEDAIREKEYTLSNCRFMCFAIMKQRRQL